MINENPNPAEPKVVGQIVVQVIAHPHGGVGVVCHSSADVIMTLGLLEAAKDFVKEQARQPQSPLVVAKGQLPKIS